MGAGGIAGAALGGLAGGMANQKEGTTDAGNVFALDPNKTGQMRTNAINSINSIQANPMLDPNSSLGQATSQIQNNPLLSQLFGQKGTMARTGQEEQDLASRGFSLKPEDYEAYGQGAGNIARQFGQSEQSLAQSLSDRGLSNSGAAGASFSGLQGNKNEQLGGLQRQIANDRMNMNMQRLGQTRNFLGQLGQQASGNINDQFNRELAGSNAANDAAAQRAQLGMQYLGAQQGQANQNLGQQQSTGHASNASNILGGVMGGASAGANAQQSGLFGGGGAMNPSAGKTASASNMKYTGNIA